MGQIKYLLLTAVIVFCINNNVYAQTAVTTSATVLQSITYTSQTNLNFGSFDATFISGSAVIDPLNSANDSGVKGTRGQDYTAGKIFISGSASQTVSVTLDNTSIKLNESTSTSTDYFTLGSITMSHVSGQNGANEGGATLTSGGDVSLDGSGDATVWLGGTLTPTDQDGGNMYAGTYENTSNLTLTIDYSF